MHYRLQHVTNWLVNENAPTCSVSAKITSTPEATAIADRDLILSVMGPTFNEDDANDVLDAITKH